MIIQTHLFKQNFIMKRLLFTLLYLSISFLGLSNTKKNNAEGVSIKKDTLSNEEATDAEDEEKKGTFAFSGYIDSYFSGNFNKPLSQKNLGIAGTARVFDQRSGQIALGLAQTRMSYTNDKSEVVVDLAFGPNADLANYANLGTALAIKQAYFSYNITDKWSATVGQFGTHIGYEVIDAPVNFNYSLSNLFGMGPFYHTGLKTTYAFSDRASLMVGIVNAVDGFGDNNRKKGVIAQLYVSPATNWDVYLNAIDTNDEDPDAAGNVPKAHYRMLDLATTYQLSEKFLLGVNAAVGSQQFGGSSNSQTWGGIAGYANLALSDYFGLGARYEFFDNSNGARALLDFNGQGTSVNSFTLTGNINLADGHVILKPEFRIDSYAARSNGEQQFEDSNGNFTEKSQSTLGIGFIYKF